MSIRYCHGWDIQEHERNVMKYGVTDDMPALLSIIPNYSDKYVIDHKLTILFEAGVGAI